MAAVQYQLTEQKELLRRLCVSRSVLVAAHRGTCGGNIVQNTLGAYKNAILHGADMLEIDAAMTVDGVFYCFHDGQEPLVLGTNKSIKTMKSTEVETYQLINSLNHKIGEKVNRLDDVLEALKGKCLINIDRSWFYWEEIIKTLDRHHMAGQILLKSPVQDRLLAALEASGSDLMYMPIVYHRTDIETVEKYNVHFAAAELIFETEDNLLLEDGYIEALHQKGLLLWANAITLDDRHILCALKDDNTAILKGPEESWGYLIRKGFDILQTDWPALMRDYVDSHRGEAARTLAQHAFSL